MTDIAPSASRSPFYRTAPLLPILLALLGPLVYATPLGVVPGLLLFGLAAGMTAWRARAFDVRGVLRGLAVFGPLLVWMLVSAAWALDARAALLLGLRLAGLFAVGVAVVHWVRTLPADRLGPCLAALAGGLTLAGAIVVIDLLALDGFIARHLHAPHGEHYDIALFYGRGATIHAVLIPALSLGLWRAGARPLAVLQLAVGVAAILVTTSLSAKTALGAGLFAGAAVFVLPRLRFALLAPLALAAATAPLLLPVHPDADTVCWLSNHKGSALHRLYIWNFAAERIAERPVFGWGLDAARRIPGGNDPVVIHGCDAQHQPTHALWVDSTVMPLHPHNAILQTWLELGGIGALFGFGALLLALFRGFSHPAWRNRRAQAGFVGATCAGLSVALVSFGIWQEWFLSSLFIAAAMAVLSARQDEDQARR